MDFKGRRKEDVSLIVSVVISRDQAAFSGSLINVHEDKLNIHGWQKRSQSLGSINYHCCQVKKEENLLVLQWTSFWSWEWMWIHLHLGDFWLYWNERFSKNEARLCANLQKEVCFYFILIEDLTNQPLLPQSVWGSRGRGCCYDAM